MGVAHHTAYPVWFEMGRTELLRGGAGLAYRDLEAAALMQRSMLPASDQSQGLNLQSLFCPATVVAGDIFSYLKLDFLYTVAMQADAHDRRLTRAELGDRGVFGGQVLGHRQRIGLTHGRLDGAVEGDISARLYHADQ